MLLTSLTVSDVFIFLTSFWVVVVYLLCVSWFSFLVLIILNDWFNDDNISFDNLLISDTAKTEVHRSLKINEL